MLVCNICEEKAKYRVTINCGRFSNNLFFCENHKPKTLIAGQMDDKQSDKNEFEFIRQTIEDLEDDKETP